MGSLGNHEFDNGVSGLTPFIRNVTTPVLAANLILDKVPDLQRESNLMNSVVFDINGTKVGVIGYLTPDTKTLAIGNDVEYVDERIAIRHEIDKLKNASVNIFIALGHSGFSTDLKIAEDVEDLDLVIGGHTNTFLWNGTSPDSETVEGPYPTIVKQKSGRLVPVVQAYAYTKYMGKLHLVFDGNGELINYDGQPILLDKSIPQDPGILDIIAKYKENVMKISEVIVGNTSVVLDAISCKVKECNMGNIITDAMVFKYASEYNGEGWTDAPIGIIQRGGIRSSISREQLPTQITKGDLLTVLPFDNTLMKVTINGSDILKMLEHSIYLYEPKKAPGHFLHFSGMKVVYNLKRSKGMRVDQVKIRCGKCRVPEYLPLNKTQEYMILMSSFLAMGGDKFSVFIGLPAMHLQYNEMDCLTQYIQTHSPVYPAVEDRITMNVASPSVSTGGILMILLVAMIYVLS